MSNVAPSSSSPGAIDEDRNRHRIMLSGFLGTSVEYYDFLLYAMASSVVFPTLFFPGESALAASLLSFATLAVGYFARPIGGVVFAHFGDRIGRKRILVVTLTLMGTTSFLIGLIPSYDAIGVAAPVMLVALRVVQGIALGGEFGGATLLSFESASSQRRGFAASVVSSGGPVGAVLANIMLATFALFPGGLAEGLGGWAWRIPFLLSAVLVGLGLYLRLSVVDSPAYRASTEVSANAPKIPLFEVLRHYPRRTITAILGGLGPLFMQGLLVTWILSYAKNLGYPQAQILWLSMVANMGTVVAILISAHVADRIGRKKVLVTGAVFGIAAVYPTFWLLQTHQWWGLAGGLMLGAGVVAGWMYGPLSGWIAEMFPTTARYTGVSLAFQVASTLGAGLAPLIATALVAAAGGNGTDPRYVVMVAIAVLTTSGLACALSRERFRDRLAHTREEDQARGEDQQEGLAATAAAVDR